MTRAAGVWLFSALRRKLRRKPERGLTYAAYGRCPCGAGLAYRSGDDCWDCSAILLDQAVPSGQDGSVQHTARLPFSFYEIKSEVQPSVNGATTRPREAA